MNQPGRKLKEIASIRTGGVLTRLKNTSLDNIGVEYDLITLKSIDERGKLNLDLTEDFQAGNEVNNEFISKKGDVIIRLREPVTATYIDEGMERLLVSSMFAIIRCDSCNIDLKYVCYFLNSEVARKQLVGYVKGSSIRMVKTSALGELEIPLPHIDRQRKVVDLIELQINEIDLIEELKSKKEILLKEYGRRLFR